MLPSMNVSIRPAVMSDIPLLAEVTEAAYGGYADVMYADSVPGMTPRQILELRLEQDGTSYRFSNGWIAEDAGQAIGAVHVYPVDDEERDPVDPFVPGDRLRYFQPMEGMVLPGSFYINAIGVAEDRRGSGIGGLLMEKALAVGAEQGFETFSLFVFDANAPAVALYKRFGFQEHIRRTPVPHPALHHNGDLLLMVAGL